MSLATSISDAQEQVNTLANCDCCERHGKNKPGVFKPLEHYAPQQRSMPRSGDCECDCRAKARRLCRAYHDIVAVEVAEAMLMLRAGRPRMLNARLLEAADVCESENGEGCVEHATAMRVAARDPAWANWRQDEAVPDQPDQGFACEREDQCMVCRRQATGSLLVPLVMRQQPLASAAGFDDLNSKCRSCDEFVCGEHQVDVDGVVVCVDCEWYV
jgi:hypothetical protein